MPEVKMSVRRTASTAAYESVTVEIQEVHSDLDESEIDGAYKELSRRVEKYVKHEVRKYKEGLDTKTVR